MFFIQAVKNNKNVTVNNNTIEFADGTRYDFNSDQKAIYRNGKAIAKNIQVAKTGIEILFSCIRPNRNR